MHDKMSTKFDQTYKKTRNFNFPNEGGIVPEMLLLYKSKLMRLFRLPSSAGIVPWMLFLYSSLMQTKWKVFEEIKIIPRYNSMLNFIALQSKLYTIAFRYQIHDHFALNNNSNGQLLVFMPTIKIKLTQKNKKIISIQIL